MKPRIFICNKYVEKFDEGITALTSLLSKIKKTIDLSDAYPMYLFSYCKYEGTLYQIFKHTIKAFPERANLNKLDLKSEEVLNCSCTGTILDLFCSSFSKKFGVGKLDQYKKQYEEILKTKIDITASIYKSLEDFKENRNQLAHHGEIDDNKVILKDEMCSHIEAAITVLTQYKDKFISTYRNYTEELLIKESCKYLFNMNTVLFDRCFFFNKNTSLQIHLNELQNWYGNASSSEQHCFLLFIANFGNSVLRAIDTSILCPRISLTDKTIEKVSFIDELFKEYPYLINHL